MKRHIEFTIEFDVMMTLFGEQNGRCALSGLEIVFGRNRWAQMHGECTASIDRIDSSYGYHPDNVQWVHKYINLMKQNLDQDHFIKLCKAVSDANRSC